MIIATSLSPGHANCDNQKAAVKSWQEFGSCVSLNSEKEIEILREQGYDGIDFVQTTRTVEGIIGKPLVNINAFFDFAKQLGQDLLLINSDIVLMRMPDLKPDGITMLSRHDYKDDINESEMFKHGWDVFYIPNNFLSIFPPSIYSMGCSWWDYFLPYRAIRASVPVYYPRAKYVFHKFHETQYSYQEWAKIGEYFRWEFDLSKTIHINQLAPQILGSIRARLIYR